MTKPQPRLTAAASCFLRAQENALYVNNSISPRQNEQLTCPVCSATEVHVGLARVIKSTDGHTTRIEVRGRCEFWHVFIITFLTYRGGTTVSMRTGHDCPAERPHSTQEDHPQG